MCRALLLTAPFVFEASLVVAVLYPHSTRLQAAPHLQQAACHTLQ